MKICDTKFKIKILHQIVSTNRYFHAFTILIERHGFFLCATAVPPEYGYSFLVREAAFKGHYTILYVLDYRLNLMTLQHPKHSFQTMPKHRLSDLYFF